MMVSAKRTIKIISEGNTTIVNFQLSICEQHDKLKFK